MAFLAERKLEARQETEALRVYKMIIDISGEDRVFIFRGPGCRKKMLEWYSDYRKKAAEQIKSIRVWGTVGNKTDVVLEWGSQKKAGSATI